MIQMTVQTAAEEVTSMPTFTDVATVVVLLFGLGLGGGFLWWVADHFIKRSS